VGGIISRSKYKGSRDRPIKLVFVKLLMLLLLFFPQESLGKPLRQYTNLWLDTNRAVLQGLDKITARVSTFELKIDELGYFGTLVIKVRSCRKRPPTETPESVAYIEILDKKSGQESVNLFNGWMFASSPTLNSLEHPVYDVWVLNCKNS